MGFLQSMLDTITGIKGERKRWNNGVSLECGTEWKIFDCDSQGNAGLQCSCPEQHSKWVWSSVCHKEDKQ